MDSPLIRATSSMMCLSSARTKRQGWLLKCEGAIAATSTSRRWCSSLTGSGKNGPLVVLRRLTTSKNSNRSSRNCPTDRAGLILPRLRADLADAEGYEARRDVAQQGRLEPEAHGERQLVGTVCLEDAGHDPPLGGVLGGLDYPHGPLPAPLHGPQLPVPERARLQRAREY